MEFFNRKEEVIDIQLTQYGKHLLSQGKFKPDSYAFFDNDIIYNTELGTGIGKETGFGEHQSQSEDRIKETPRPKEQRIYSGAETRMKMITLSDEVYDKETHEKAAAIAASQPVAEKVYTLSAPLGTSAFNSDSAPSWDVKFTSGKLAKALSHIEGKQERTRIEFSSATKADYEDSSGNGNTKFITLSTARPNSKKYKFYFDAGNEPAEPTTGASHNILADSVDIDTAPATVVGIATAFKNAVNKIPGFETVLAINVALGKSYVTVSNTRFGIASDVQVSNDLSDAITATVLEQGKDGASVSSRIPQLDCELETVIRVISEEMYDNGEITDDDLTLTDDVTGYDNEGNPITYGIVEEGIFDPESTPFEDNSFFKIDHDELVLDIKEQNAPFSNENFDLEIYQIIHESNGEEGLRPLKFSGVLISLLDDVAYDSKGNIIANKTFDKSNAQEDKNYVDYYLDISVDDEIQLTRKYAIPVGPEEDALDEPQIQSADIFIPELPINNFLCPEDQATINQEAGNNPGNLHNDPDPYEPL